MSLFDIQDEIRRSVTKEQVQIWLKIDSKIAYRHLVVDWLGVIMGLIAYALCPTWWMLLLSFFSVGFCQYALFILGHDALHGSMLADRKLNDTISRWLIHGPMLMGFDDGKFNHLEHHKLLGAHNDPDRYLHTLSNKNSPFQFFLFCTGLATFGKTVLKVTPFGKLLLRQAAIESKKEQVNGSGAQGDSTSTAVTAAGTGLTPSIMQTLVLYFKQRIPVMVSQPVLLIFLLVVLHLPWWSYFVLWIAPIYLCVFVADEARAFCDHAVLTMPDTDADTLRLVTYVPSTLETTIFSPHNMNYHAEHHLWPMIPYYNRPRAHQAINPSRHVTVHKSYLKFLSTVFASVPLSCAATTADTVYPPALES